MTKQQTPEIPDLMDGLIQAPTLEQEIAKLGAWLLKQDGLALQNLPVSALGSLAEYVRGRVHEDRCERFIQDSKECAVDPDKYYPRPMPVGVNDEDEVKALLSEQPPAKPLPVPVGGLETMWPQAPEAQQVPEIVIPRPAV